MARSFNVSYRFSAKDGFSAVSKKIRAGNRKLGDSFKKLNDRVRKSDSRFKQTSNNFAGGFKRMAGAAIAFFSIRGFFTQGAKFQDALADLSAITGATGKDLDNLKNKTLSMAKASVTSQSDVAEAIKLVASAKPDLLDNIDALTATTKQVLLLKNAAGIELADAANITAQGLNIFGASADQASRFVNVLAAGAKLGSSEIAETGEAMLIAGPAAKAAGLSFEQLNAIIQTTAKGGIKASRAGTAINAILGRLQRSGIDFQKLGLQGSFEVIKKKMDSMKNSTQRAQFAAKIFGEEHSKVGFALLDNVGFLGKYEKSLAGTNIAEEQAAIRLDTFSAKTRKLGVILNDAVIKTFLRLEPIISKQVSQFADFMDTIDPAQVNAFADSIGILAKGIGMIASGFGVVLSVLKKVGTLIGEVAAGIATLDFSHFSKGIATIDQSRFLAGTDIRGNIISANELAPTGPPASPGDVTAGGESRTLIDVNLNAPEGVVQSVKSSTTGVRNANVGVNMAGG